MKRLASGVRGEAFSDDSFLLPDDPAPDPGLYRFEATDDWLFFGRDDDTRLLIDKLVNSSIVTIVGPSGSGKSSLVRAGLIPKLGELPGCETGAWQTLLCTPSDNPFRRLAEQVARLSPSGRSRVTEVDESRDRFAHLTDGLITALRAYSADKPGPVLLVIDQFEELFTLGPDTGTHWKQQAAMFVANLACVPPPLTTPA